VTSLNVSFTQDSSVIVEPPNSKPKGQDITDSRQEMNDQKDPGYTLTNSSSYSRTVGLFSISVIQYLWEITQCSTSLVIDFRNSAPQSRLGALNNHPGRETCQDRRL